MLMYGQGGLPVGLATTATGVAVLPNTGGIRPLFIAALAVTAVGVITVATSVVVAFKQRTQA
jgi:hypothetical protein